MHQRASPLMPFAVQCPLFGPLSGLQSCDMRRLHRTCDAPPLASLFWEGQDSRTPICARVYEEAVGAGIVFVLCETSIARGLPVQQEAAENSRSATAARRGAQGLGVAMARNSVDRGEAGPFGRGPDEPAHPCSCMCGCGRGWS